MKAGTNTTTCYRCGGVCLEFVGRDEDHYGEVLVSRDCQSCGYGTSHVPISREWVRRRLVLLAAAKRNGAQRQAAPGTGPLELKAGEPR